MPTELRNLDVSFVSLVDRAAVRDPSNPTEPQKLLLWKAERGANHNGGDMPTADELSAALKKAEQERDEALAEVAKAKKRAAKKPKGEKGEKPEVEEFDKSELPPAVREALEKAERDADQSRKQAEKAEEIAKAERDERVTREFVSKAERDYRMLPVNPSEFGPVLKAMSEKLADPEREAIETLLKAADEHLRQNSQMLKELGRSGDPTPGEDSEIAEQLRKADELRKSNPGMSRFDAMKAAMGSREQQAAYLANVR